MFVAIIITGQVIFNVIAVAKIIGLDYRITQLELVEADEKYHAIQRLIKFPDFLSIKL